MDERTVRIGRNEALFRAVNERIETLSDPTAQLTETFGIVCECGDSGCIRQLQVTPGEYERIRADSALFFVVPGHQVEDVEDVVDRHEKHFVVRKRSGLPELVADLTDPRGG